MNTTDRLYALVEELRAIAPQWRSAQWFAGRFEASSRTIERDLSALQTGSGGDATFPVVAEFQFDGDRISGFWGFAA